MPTVLTFTIGPSGKQYTSMTACRAANAKNLVTADEQHIYEFYTFSGGLNDNDAFSGYTDDATRNVILTTALSDRWDGIDPTTGFYFKNSGGAVLRPVSGTQNMSIDYICVDGSSSSSGFFSTSNGGNFKSASNLCLQDVALDNIPNGFNGTLDNVLIVRPGDDGGTISTAANKLTVISASNRGIVSLGGSAITNSFSFGSTNADFSNQGGTHSNNATEDATAGGANPQINRTTADFVNYASGDYRTASASALATAGTVDFIGYALEAGGGGITVTGSTASFDYSAIAGSVDLTGEILVTGNTADFDYTAISGLIDLTGELLVLGQTASFDFDALNGSVDLTGEISVTGKTALFDYNALNGAVGLTGQINVTGQTANIDFNAVIANIDLTGEINVIGSTANFDYLANTGNVELGAVINITGQTANFDFNGITASVELTGEITIVGQTATFDYIAKSGNVIIGSGQKIGAITAGYAEDQYSVKYKQNNITIKFGE